MKGKERKCWLKKARALRKAPCVHTNKGNHRYGSKGKASENTRNANSK